MWKTILAVAGGILLVWLIKIVIGIIGTSALYLFFKHAFGL